jgi:AcrR family transcriptional regulator
LVGADVHVDKNADQHSDNHAEERKPRLRRTSDEIKILLRDAASGSFVKNGYAGTSTRAIASEAGVSETLLFRHFGTKSGLFEATTLEKFRVSTEHFLERWVQAEPGDAERAAAFLRDLLYFFRENRGVMLALMTVDSAQDEDISSIKGAALESFGELLGAIRANVLTGADGELYAGVDARLTSSSVAGALLCVTVLDEWLFREGICQPSFDEIDAEVVAYVLDGVGHRG